MVGAQVGTAAHGAVLQLLTRVLEGHATLSTGELDHVVVLELEDHVPGGVTAVGAPRVAGHVVGHVEQLALVVDDDFLRVDTHVHPLVVEGQHAVGLGVSVDPLLGLLHGGEGRGDGLLVQGHVVHVSSCQWWWCCCPGTPSRG